MTTMIKKKTMVHLRSVKPLRVDQVAAAPDTRNPGLLLRSSGHDEPPGGDGGRAPAAADDGGGEEGAAAPTPGEEGGAEALDDCWRRRRHSRCLLSEDVELLEFGEGLVW